MSNHIKKLWRQNTCDIVQCDNCEFCFSHPFIAGDKDFYELAYNESEYPKWKWEHQLTYDSLKNNSCLINFKLLEIGAGDGAFVKKISNSLTNKKNILCTEFSDYGVRSINKYGIKCLSDDIRKIKSYNYKNAFDYICLFQVIEHMDNLDALFKHLTWLTNKKSSLFISVPNPKYTEFNENNGALMDMPLNHVGRWNRKCFEIMGERWGWKIVRYEIETSSVLTKIKSFYLYRFLYQSKKSNTLANYIMQIKKPKTRKYFGMIGVGLYFITSIFKINLVRESNHGVSQWIQMKKIDNSMKYG